MKIYNILYILYNFKIYMQVKIIKSCAMQIDGEPWYQHPCEFNIKYCNKATILMNSIKKTI